MTNAKQSGFTQVELLITLAVVAILAAVGYPSYTQHTRKAYRADAQAVLMDAATRQQQYRLDTGNYADTLDKLKVSVPASLSGRYTVTLVIATNTFSLSAAPQGTQTKDSCGTLGVDQAGVKTPGTCW